MRARVTTSTAGGAALLCATVLAAQEAPPAEYVQAMTEIGAAVQVFSQFSETQDFEAASLAAQSAATAFEYVQQFWEGRDPDAGRLAATALKAAQDARVAAGLTSAEGVSYATGEMIETCMSCHAAHREEVSDGTYRIK
jgi:cytochrome c556